MFVSFHYLEEYFEKVTVDWGTSLKTWGEQVGLSIPEAVVVDGRVVLSDCLLVNRLEGSVISEVPETVYDPLSLSERSFTLEEVMDPELDSSELIYR